MHARGAKLIYWLTISDLCFGITMFTNATLNLIVGEEMCGSALCAVLGMFYQYFLGCVALWTGSIAVDLHLSSMVTLTSNSHAHRRLPWMHTLCWLLPGVVVASIAISSDGSFSEQGQAFGFAGNFCWIREVYWEQWIFAYYGPLAIIMSYSLVVYLRIQCLLNHVRRQLEGLQGSTPTPSQTGGLSVPGAAMLSENSRRLSSFTLVFALIFALEFSHRLYTTNGGDSFGLSMLQALSTPLQGFGDMLVYGGSPSVRRAFSRRRRNLLLAAGGDLTTKQRGSGDSISWRSVSAMLSARVSAHGQSVSTITLPRGASALPSSYRSSHGKSHGQLVVSQEYSIELRPLEEGSTGMVTV